MRIDSGIFCLPYLGLHLLIFENALTPTNLAGDRRKKSQKISKFMSILSRGGCNALARVDLWHLHHAVLVG